MSKEIRTCSVKLILLLNVAFALLSISLFSVYFVFLRQGTNWETNVRAGRIILYLKSVIWWFMPFLNFCIAVGHIAVMIKKLHNVLLVLNLFFRLKSFIKTSSCRQPSTAQHCCSTTCYRLPTLHKVMEGLNAKFWSTMKESTGWILTISTNGCALGCRCKLIHFFSIELFGCHQGSQPLFYLCLKFQQPFRLPMPVSPSGVSGISARRFRNCRGFDKLWIFRVCNL